MGWVFWALLFFFGLIVLLGGGAAAGGGGYSGGDNWRDGPSDWLMHEHNEKEFDYELKSKYECD